ncbi:ABC transporter G family member 5 [Phalaenopsis equestris]|uniref:ABC transporter G family member 5 n=1 Tax=Phalaenopsis equestris TaxID=78828 RepID=UPI0009E52424|nr:ABC transporter G family member 5 [Phalaenopsis equestris]
MRKQGYEIVARGITYTIQSCHPSHRFFKKIWSSDEPADPEFPIRQPPAVRHVLNNVTCRAKPWEILAVVGPSGAGKSTLLELLAGRIPLPPPPATILVDDLPLSKRSFSRISAFVPQKDCLFPLLTVRETIAFTARLRLRLTSTELRPRVEALLVELGLAPVAALRVSSISGGERRRLSIAVEAVHDPAVLILDEPTSGLDSSSALQIVDMLRSMAESRGRTVVLSIHQPCSRIVKLFGSLLLLSEGKVLHHGTIADLISRLAAAGHPLPAHTNPVEFAIDSIDSLSQLQRNEKADHCTLQQLFQIQKVADSHSELFNLEFDYANNPAVETAILTLRFMKNVSRTKELFTCRTIQMLLSGLVLGSIFFDLKFDIAGARDRVGLFAFILTFLLSCTTEALPIFLKEREILMKETFGGAYRVSSYVIANGLVFLPFLFILAFLFASPVYWLAGLDRSLSSFAFFLLLIWLILYTANSVVVCFSSLAPNFIVGNSVISGVMGSFFLFSGYFIRKEEMPGCWVFMNYLSLFRYPFQSFLVNEFSGEGKCLEEKFGVCLLDGDALLKKEGLGSAKRWKDVMVMVGFILGYRFCSFVILNLRNKRAKKGSLKKAFFDL